MATDFTATVLLVCTLNDVLVTCIGLADSKRAGVLPKFETLNGQDPVAFILSMNLASLGSKGSHLKIQHLTSKT
jgi:hypothetical protein